MKQGTNLMDMAAELQRQLDAKKDYIAPTEQLEMQPNASLTIASEAYPITPHAHNQIGDRTKIPAKYYRRMLEEAPALLANNINHWFRANPEKRMIRTLDGKVRAFLSDRYRRIDHYDVVAACLPVLKEFDDLSIESIGLTDKKLYLKATRTNMLAEIQKGDVVRAGIQISNSEIGGGCLRIEPLVYRLVCTNGLTITDEGMRRYHLGRQLEAEGDNWQIFTDDTKAADDKALLLKVRDTVRAATGEALFQKIVEDMQETTQHKIEGSPVRAIEVLAKKIPVTQDEQSNILTHFIQGSDLSQWGLINAVTRTAEDCESYDRASEFEALGHKIMTLPKDTWRELATAK